MLVHHNDGRLAFHLILDLYESSKKDDEIAKFPLLQLCFHITQYKESRSKSNIQQLES